ncbi:MAG: bis(5'-nucleosyl)-tetraphosphatase (symmetrical) YqeK [Bacillota bacterium]
MGQEKELISFIKQELSKYLFQHCLAVADTAEKLAQRYELDIEKTRAAALLHDVAKEKNKEELMVLISNDFDQIGWQIDETERQLLPVLHAPAAVPIIINKLGIKDREILEAVRYHTIGSPDMGKIAQILYLADMIAPGRNFPGIENLREQATYDLNLALISACDKSLRYNLAHRRIIHPNTLLFRNNLLKGEK